MAPVGFYRRITASTEGLAAFSPTLVRRFDSALSWSPDGRYLAWLRETDHNEHEYPENYVLCVQEVTAEGWGASHVVPAYTDEFIARTDPFWRDQWRWLTLGFTQAAGVRPIWSPDGAYIAVIGYRQYRYVAEGNNYPSFLTNPGIAIRAWDSETGLGEVDHYHPLPDNKDVWDNLDADWNADGTLLAIVYETRSNTWPAVLTRHLRVVTFPGMATQYQTVLCSGTYEGTVRSLSIRWRGDYACIRAYVAVPYGSGGENMGYMIRRGNKLQFASGAEPADPTGNPGGAVPIITADRHLITPRPPVYHPEWMGPHGYVQDYTNPDAWWRPVAYPFDSLGRIDFNSPILPDVIGDTGDLGGWGVQVAGGFQSSTAHIAADYNDSVIVMSGSSGSNKLYAVPWVAGAGWGLPILREPGTYDAVLQQGFGLSLRSRLALIDYASLAFQALERLSVYKYAPDVTVDEASPGRSDGVAVDVVADAAIAGTSPKRLSQIGGIADSFALLMSVSPQRQDSLAVYIPVAASVVEGSPARADRVLNVDVAAIASASPKRSDGVYAAVAAEISIVEGSAPSRTDGIQTILRDNDVYEVSPRRSDLIIVSPDTDVPADLAEDDYMDLVLSQDEQEILVNLGTTGLSVENFAIQVWKSGFESFGVSEATLDREVGNGRYVVKLTDTDVDTEGPVAFLVSNGFLFGYVAATVKAPEPDPEPAPLSTPIPPGLFR